MKDRNTELAELEIRVQVLEAEQRLENIVNALVPSILKEIEEESSKVDSKRKYNLYITKSDDSERFEVRILEATE